MVSVLTEKQRDVIREFASYGKLPGYHLHHNMSEAEAKARGIKRIVSGVVWTNLSKKLVNYGLIRQVSDAESPTKNSQTKRRKKRSRISLGNQVKYFGRPESLFEVDEVLPRGRFRISNKAGIVEVVNRSQIRKVVSNHDHDTTAKPYWLTEDGILCAVLIGADPLKLEAYMEEYGLVLSDDTQFFFDLCIKFKNDPELKEEIFDLSEQTMFGNGDLLMVFPYILELLTRKNRERNLRWLVREMQQRKDFRKHLEELVLSLAKFVVSIPEFEIHDLGSKNSSRS